jgi:hypothetical protein
MQKSGRRRREASAIICVGRRIHGKELTTKSTGHKVFFRSRSEKWMDFWRGQIQ